MLMCAACTVDGTPSAAPTAALFTAVPTATATLTEPTATLPPELVSPAELRLTAQAAVVTPAAAVDDSVAAAQDALAVRLGVAPESVEVLHIEETRWGWAALVCQDEDHSADMLPATPALTPTATRVMPTPTGTVTMARTPTRTPIPTRTPTPTATPAPVTGSRALLLLADTVYEARLTAGSAPVFCTEGSLYDDYPLLLLARDPVAAELVVVAQGRLGRELDLPEAVMQPVSVRPLTWPDASLGCPAPDQTYPPRPIPGYRIVLRVGEAEYRFHTDFERVLRCDAPE